MRILENKNVLITGSNRGIGSSMLAFFAAQGANIWAHSRFQTEEFNTHCHKLSKKEGVEISPIYFDLEKKDEILKAVKDIKNSNFQIDGLVNNAGITHNALLQMTSEEHLHRNLLINFVGPFLLTQLIVKLMARSKSGSIVSISSSAAIDGNSGRSAYGASKAALITATKSLSREVGLLNIRANSIAPGITETDMINSMTDEVINQTINSTCLNRCGNPQEIASVAAYLISDMSSYITGQTIRVDGGM